MATGSDISSGKTKAVATDEAAEEAIEEMFADIDEENPLVCQEAVILGRWHNVQWRENI